MNKIIQKAILVWVAFFFTAVVQSEERETYQDLIEKAQNLILQKDRLKASRVLQQGLNIKGLSESGRGLVQKSLNQTSTVFLTDKAQKEFQLADSMYFSGKPEALAKYEEASRLEPHNVLILQALARAYLSKEKCTKALQVVLKGYDVNPLDEELSYYQVRALFCLERVDQARKIMTEFESRPGPFQPYIYLLEAAQSMKDKKSALALKLAQKAQAIDESYPQAYYWLWRARPKEESLETESAEKYVELCKPLGPKMRRKYQFDPELCHFVREVDDFIKKRVSN